MTPRSMASRLIPALVCAALWLWALPVPAAESAAAPESGSKEKPAAEPAKAKPDKPKEEEEKVVESKHEVTLGGQTIAYTARAGLLPLRDAEDKVTASVFYIAYTRDGVTNRAARPVTFSFNGGPGSSSVWLHLGLLGPRRVHLEENGFPVQPPYRLVDNESSLLDETDLVFIDPVSTGFSRAAKPDDARKFHGVEEDVASVADFIRLYVTRNDRWGSPKFLIGESYGTTRAAALSSALTGYGIGINLNGIMLVSTVLNFETILFDQGNDLPYLAVLPTYTAAAWYHKKLPAELQKLPLAELLTQSETFATTTYATALLRGASLPAEERRKVVRQMARLTGLSEAYIEDSNLRVPLGRFAKELLAREHLVVGRFDARYTGPVQDRINPGMEYDPSGSGITGAYAATFNQYVRGELRYETDLPYKIINPAVQPWNWGEENNYLDVSGRLATAMTQNPFLKIHVSSGLFDLATPYYGTHYTFNTLRVDPALLKNVTHDSYQAGHMMYVNLPDLKKQKADLAKFIRASSNVTR